MFFRRNLSKFGTLSKIIAVEVKRKAQVAFAPALVSLERSPVRTQHSHHTLPTVIVPYIHVSKPTLENKSKRQVSYKTTSRLATAECYQDNSIENPLKQEQNSGHFLAKLITDYYY